MISMTRTQFWLGFVAWGVVAIALGYVWAGNNILPDYERAVDALRACVVKQQALVDDQVVCYNELDEAITAFSDQAADNVTQVESYLDLQHGFVGLLSELTEVRSDITDCRDWPFSDPMSCWNVLADDWAIIP